MPKPRIPTFSVPGVDGPFLDIDPSPPGQFEAAKRQFLDSLHYVQYGQQLSRQQAVSRNTKSWRRLSGWPGPRDPADVVRALIHRHIHHPSPTALLRAADTPASIGLSLNTPQHSWPASQAQWMLRFRSCRICGAPIAPSPAIRFDLLGATGAAASRSGGGAIAMAGELGSGTSQPRPLSAPTPSTTPRDDTTEQS